MPSAGDALERLVQAASEGTPPAAGPATAVALALAAGLAELTAEVSGRPETAARARSLRARVAPLALEDAAAYEAYLEHPSDPAARERTIELPARMAALAEDIAETAAEAAEGAKPILSADAAAGAVLAAACARTAANLVRVNVGEGVPDERVERSLGAAASAAEAAERALDAR